MLPNVGAEVQQGGGGVETPKNSFTISFGNLHNSRSKRKKKSNKQFFKIFVSKIFKK